MVVRAVVESPPLQGFKSCVHVALGDMVALAVLGEWLGLVTSEGFSSPGDSMAARDNVERGVINVFRSYKLEAKPLSCLSDNPIVAFPTLEVSKSKLDRVWSNLG
ncbi:hypothetical protein HGM15179_013580 [Zosterops borbonicus]|uniref:Uncharacterized protein n=1 Tax=Zosterops borbonicus TaxID=364589 RepID=A0A8K1G7R3_9PASS|nr:hypothetical protein HGM15179_013580 [Zosterops borbonicus]